MGCLLIICALAMFHTYAPVRPTFHCQYGKRWTKHEWFSILHHHSAYTLAWYVK